MPPGNGIPPARKTPISAYLLDGRSRSNLRAMKMHLDHTGAAHRITGYGAGYVSVNDKPLTQSFVITPETLITDWAPRSAADLDEAALEVIAQLSPGIVLLGTGERQSFPPSSLLAPMLGRGVGVEVMTTAAACRTYNILIAEGRTVAAGLLVP